MPVRRGAGRHSRPRAGLPQLQGEVAAAESQAGAGVPAAPSRTCRCPRRSMVGLASPVARGGGSMTVLLPFTPVDELGCHVDSAAEPNGIHLEVRVDGHLDAARLRAAVLASLAAHPLARALRVRWRGWHRRFTWAIADAPAVAPLDEVRWRTEDDLAGHRASLLAAAPPLDLGPPLRFRHAVGPDQDMLFLNVHHAAMDGMSCLRLLRSVARR